MKEQTTNTYVLSSISPFVCASLKLVPAVLVISVIDTMPASNQRPWLLYVEEDFVVKFVLTPLAAGGLIVAVRAALELGLPVFVPITMRALYSSQKVLHPTFEIYRRSPTIWFAPGAGFVRGWRCSWSIVGASESPTPVFIPIAVVAG